MAARKRADSVTSAVVAMVNASMPDLAVPAHNPITKNAEPYWLGVVRARARDEWTESSLVIAAQLAQCMADFADEDATLRKEGRVIPNDRRTLVMNPRVTVLEQLARREMALMRTLQMGGRIASDARDQAGKRDLEKQSRKIKEELGKDGLLA